MLEPNVLNWACWAFFAWAVMATLEPWGKLDPELLPIYQRVLSPLLAICALSFWIWMLVRVYKGFGGIYTAKAFFASWFGMLGLTVLIFGSLAVVIKALVKEPSERGPYLATFRYGFFAPKLALAVLSFFLLLRAYP